MSVDAFVSPPPTSSKHHQAIRVPLPWMQGHLFSIPPGGSAEKQPRENVLHPNHHHHDAQRRVRRIMTSFLLSILPWIGAPIMPIDGIGGLRDSAIYSHVAMAAMTTSSSSSCMVTTEAAKTATSAAVNLPEDVIATGIVDVATKSAGNLDR